MIDVRLSPNHPARTEPETLRSGPSPTGSTTPNSPASIVQSPPSVPANPNDNACPTPATGADRKMSTRSVRTMGRRTCGILSRKAGTDSLLPWGGRHVPPCASEDAIVPRRPIPGPRPSAPADRVGRARLLQTGQLDSPDEVALGEKEQHHERHHRRHRRGHLIRPVRVVDAVE